MVKNLLPVFNGCFIFGFHFYGPVIIRNRVFKLSKVSEADSPVIICLCKIGIQFYGSGVVAHGLYIFPCIVKGNSPIIIRKIKGRFKLIKKDVQAYEKMIARFSAEMANDDDAPA